MTQMKTKCMLCLQTFDLSQNVQDQFDFAEHYSCDEDAVLDNSGDKKENVMPLKPRPKKK